MDKENEQFYRKNLSPEMFEAWKALQENARRLLDFPEYSLGDVLEVTGLSRAQLMNWLSRKRNLITISGEQNPGHGRRRLYTGRDILLISAALKLSSIGLPIELVKTLSQTIEKRAEIALTAPHNLMDANVILFMEEGKWRWATGWLGKFAVDDKAGPEIFVVFEVDRLIVRVLTELAEMKGRYFVSGTADDLRKAAAKIEKKEGESE